jgi:hypothetical protein
MEKSAFRDSAYFCFFVRFDEHVVGASLEGVDPQHGVGHLEAQYEGGVAWSGCAEGLPVAIAEGLVGYHQAQVPGPVQDLYGLTAVASFEHSQVTRFQVFPEHQQTVAGYRKQGTKVHAFSPKPTQRFFGACKTARGRKQAGCHAKRPLLSVINDAVYDRIQMSPVRLTGHGRNAIEKLPGSQEMRKGSPNFSCCDVASPGGLLRSPLCAESAEVALAHELSDDQIKRFRVSGATCVGRDHIRARTARVLDGSCRL